MIQAGIEQPVRVVAEGVEILRIERVIGVHVSLGQLMSFFRVSTSSASFAGLSQRMRWKRGKRKARPDLWRVDSCTLSNSNSATSAGDSTRTGPKRSTVLLRTQRSSLFSSSSVKPE